LPRAFLPGGAVTEAAAAGSDALLPVLPTTQLLTGPFAPSSDQSWLTIDSVANGVVHFSFTQNAGSSRTAHLTVLGQQIAVTQKGGPPHPPKPPPPHPPRPPPGPPPTKPPPPPPGPLPPTPPPPARSSPPAPSRC